LASGDKITHKLHGLNTGLAGECATVAVATNYLAKLNPVCKHNAVPPRAATVLIRVENVHHTGLHTQLRFLMGESLSHGYRFTQTHTKDKDHFANLQTISEGAFVSKITPAVHNHT
jgi:hypothetical protein